MKPGRIEYIDVKVPAGSIFNSPYTKRMRQSIHRLVDWYLDTWPDKSLVIDMTPAVYRRHKVHPAEDLPEDLQRLIDKKLRKR